ncbi:hypothetical protein IWX91DRAFT_111140 [Phyllosticta citricarpa]
MTRLKWKGGTRGRVGWRTEDQAARTEVSTPSPFHVGDGSGWTVVDSAPEFPRTAMRRGIESNVSTHKRHHPRFLLRGMPRMQETAFQNRRRSLFAPRKHASATHLALPFPHLAPLSASLFALPPPNSTPFPLHLLHAATLRHEVTTHQTYRHKDMMKLTRRYDTTSTLATFACLRTSSAISHVTFLMHPTSFPLLIFRLIYVFHRFSFLFFRSRLLLFISRQYRAALVIPSCFGLFFFLFIFFGFEKLSSGRPSLVGFLD